MRERRLNTPVVNPFYRCSGPNCGLIKSSSDRWWLMWTSSEDERPLLHLCTWDEEVALREGALAVCGEQCAQRLQSQFMGNLLQSTLRASAPRKPHVTDADGRP